MPDIFDNLEQTTFRAEVIRSLHHLFNPAELRQTELISLYGLGNSYDGPASLRRVFMDAIESLKPGGASTESKAWLLYQVLHYRFSENIPQKEVASAMSKSIRQLRRIENQGMDVLIDVLWNRLPNQAQVRENPIASTENTGVEAKPDSEGSEMPSSTQEIDQLDHTMHTDVIHLKNLVEGALTTLLPVTRQQNVDLKLVFPEKLPMVSAKAVQLRQGILTILAPLLSKISEGMLLIQAETQANGQTVILMIQAFQAGGLNPEILRENDESLGFARLLIQAAGGLLEPAREPALDGSSLVIKLPALTQIKVLAIDDNADVLQLMQRYTWNTRYNLAVLKDQQNILALIEELSPQIIILDVMMTETDGWELLGRLCEHPQMHAIAIIICTILPQESLALTLGAAGFLRKPVSRKAFLEALDLQAAHLELESRQRLRYKP